MISVNRIVPAMESRSNPKRARVTDNEAHEPMQAWRRLILKIFLVMAQVTSLTINLVFPKPRKAPFSVWPLSKIPEGGFPMWRAWAASR